MADIFHSLIRKSLADANLQAALDANATKRIKVRQEAFASITDPQASRLLARAVRADVIDHLDSYLQEFISHASENGIQVHHAEHAIQAVQLVLDIAIQHGAKLIAKSKTMVSEEISLNHALENQGLQVIETDLGEYIVQLRGEAPSHIITPAVHLRRQDVGRLFEEKLGLPYTEDISVMTDLARKTLRQVFLNADLGISGVNFGVAETGTLCVVTNEGNARMVTTLPRAHIALMGIERLLPKMDDLALMLSLLPRSATGQKLSVYTSLLNSPRRSGDPDGPLERHLILVNNGRMAVLSSELKEILYCIRCGACLNACPVFREIGGHAYVSRAGKGSPYPGPMGSVVSPALFGQLEYGHLARASSLCSACREACPVDIDLPKLLLRVRAGVQVGAQPPVAKPNTPRALALGLKFYTFVASSAWRFTAAQRLAGIFGALVSIFSRNGAWLHLPAVTGWGYSKDFPRPSSQTFRKRYQKLQPAATFSTPESSSTKLDSPHGLRQSELELHLSRNLEEIFAAELTSLGGHFTKCSIGELASKIIDLLHGREIDHLLVWDSSYFPAGLTDQLVQSGLQLRYPSRETLASDSLVRAGLTGVLVGIADTGSLVIPGGPGQPLTASLLPEIHIAVLREKDIVQNLSQVLTRDELIRSTAAVIITGPSRTADIEMTLTIGVHGPGELHVLCIPE